MKFWKILWLLLFLLVKTGNCDNVGNHLTNLWTRFWTLSCHYSTVETRAKRSINLPDQDNPTELFDYFFPLADVKPTDLIILNQTQSRSFPSTSTWIDDLLDLWHSECHRLHKNKRRRRKRSRIRNQGVQPKEDTMTWTEYGNLSYYTYESTTTETVLSVEEEPEEMEEFEHVQEGDEIVEDEEEKPEEEESEETTTPEGSDEEEEEEEDEGSKEKKKKKEKVTEPPTTTTTTTTAAPPAMDPAFVSYGGDIEYFYPLVSFGIPFDGEIVVLGFHGFKGLLPY